MQLVYILGVSLIGSLVAQWVGLPLPYLLGSLVASATLSINYYSRTQKRLKYPRPMRTAFVAVIGTMIGTTFSPDLVGLAVLLWPSLIAMAIYILIGEAVGFVIYRYIGRYDLTTSLFSAMPGGLVEAVLYGEKSGGNLEILSLQHFTRIILVVIIVPVLFFVWTGEVVGSAAGETLESSPAEVIDWVIILGLAGLGVAISTRLSLPAGHMVWPMSITATLHATGVLDASGPSILLNISQLAVGASLGCNFAQSTLRKMLKGFGLGLIYVGITLGIAVAFSLGLAQIMPLTFETLVASYAPGGLTEMSLIALTLGASPLLVAAHHLYRIIMAVVLAAVLAKYLERQGGT